MFLYTAHTFPQKQLHSIYKEYGKSCSCHFLGKSETKIFSNPQAEKWAGWAPKLLLLSYWVQGNIFFSSFSPWKTKCMFYFGACYMWENKVINPELGLGPLGAPIITIHVPFRIYLNDITVPFRITETVTMSAHGTASRWHKAIMYRYTQISYSGANSSPVNTTTSLAQPYT